MILLQPLLLVLAALGGAALIIAYYLRRRQAPKVPFSAVRFLPQASHTRTPRASLPPVRILFLLAILVLGTLSVAQPMLARTQATPVGLIIDDSAFASGKDQALRQIGLAIARNMGADNHWAVFSTSGMAIAASTGGQSLSVLLESYATDNLKASYSPAVFKQATTFLRERAGGAPMLVLVGSPDTLSGYPGLDHLRAELEKEDVRLAAIVNEAGGRSVFIAATDMPRLAKLGGEVKPRIGIANTGGETVTGEVRLMNQDKVLMKVPVRLQARSLTWQEIKATPQNSGQNKYQIVLSAGDIEDRVLWEVGAFDPQKVVIIASTGSSPGYIEKAFRASPLVETVTVVDPEALGVANLRQFLSSTKLVVMDGVDAAVFPNELGSEVRGWVENGGTLVFASGPKVTEAWNKNSLAPVLPTVLKLKKDKLLQGVTVRDHPLTRNLELESTPLTVSQWFSVDPPAKEPFGLKTILRAPTLPPSISPPQSSARAFMAARCWGLRPGLSLFARIFVS